MCIFLNSKTSVQTIWQKAASCIVPLLRIEPFRCMPLFYWQLSDAFCCIHRSKISKCFSVDRTTPKITSSRGKILTPSDPHFRRHIRVSPPPYGILIGSAIFACHIRVINTRPDRHRQSRQTTIHATSVAIGCIYVMYVMRPNKWLMGRCMSCSFVGVVNLNLFSLAALWKDSWNGNTNFLYL